nr:MULTISPECIES: hypothetical protein [unclassified Rhizobium]
MNRTELAQDHLHSTLKSAYCRALSLSQVDARVAFAPVKSSWARALFKNLEGKDMENFVYLLEPESAIFRAAELPDRNSIASIAGLIGSDLIQMIRFDDMHSLFVGEEALRVGLTAFTIFDRYPIPLAGQIALLGGDGSKPYRSPSITMTEAARRFECCRPVLDPVFVPMDRVANKGLIVAGALEGLQVRIDRRSPVLL